MKAAALRPQAKRDLCDITAHYRKEGGETLALEWADAIEAALHQLADFPTTGSTRYATITGIEGLRSWPMNRFPYLIFYIEGATVDVLRVLHASRDLPERMRGRVP